MITADSAFELRRILYELEDYLAKYPHSPEARLLQHRLQEALRRAESLERPAPTPWGRPEWGRYRRHSPTEGLGCASIIVLAVILYLIFRLVVWLF